MASRSRIRTRIDVGRLREAMAGPGADPRSWVARARVDDDDDAMTWDAQVGWIVDVTILGGQLDGEGPIPCLVAYALAGDGEGTIAPFERGQVVSVIVADGNLNEGGLIVGAGFSDDRRPPTVCAGEDVTEDYAKANVFTVSSKRRVFDVPAFVVQSDEVLLANREADQSFVRGDDRNSADGDFLTALTTWAELVRAGVAAGGGSLDNSSLTEAIATYREGLAGSLSSKIKGE